jgi:hypothetical protein
MVRNSARWKRFSLRELAVCALIAVGGSWLALIPSQRQNAGPSTSWFPVSLSLGLPDSGVLGDFDGDRRADVAIARPQGFINGAYRYRVEVLFSEQPAGGFDVESGPAGGLHLSARDVDGDHDLDLVITSDFGRQPVGIWINDGHGRFTHSAPEVYPKSIWQEPNEELERPAPPNRPVAFAVCGSGSTLEPARAALPALCNRNLAVPLAPDGVASNPWNPGNPFRAPPLS